MRRGLRALSEDARRAGLPAGAATFPAPVQRFFSNVSGYEPAEFIRRLTPTSARSALVVGVGAGRDAHWLALHGLVVTSVDIAPQDTVDRLVLADMAALPFADNRFDVVVVADALEHTFQDREALLEFRRVLSVSGAFLLNVPYGDDAGEHHVRVYTEATLRRLLSSAGFAIESKVYRGCFPILEQVVPGFRPAFHGVNLLAHVLRVRPYERMLRWMTDFDWRHSEHAVFRRLYKGHGAYVVARPCSVALNYTHVNRRVYEQQGARMSKPSRNGARSG